MKWLVCLFFLQFQITPFCEGGLKSWSLRRSLWWCRSLVLWLGMSLIGFITVWTDVVIDTVGLVSDSPNRAIQVDCVGVTLHLMCIHHTRTQWWNVMDFTRHIMLVGVFFECLQGCHRFVRCIIVINIVICYESWAALMKLRCG